MDAMELLMGLLKGRFPCASVSNGSVTPVSFGSSVTEDLLESIFCQETVVAGAKGQLEQIQAAR